MFVVVINGPFINGQFFTPFYAHSTTLYLCDKTDMMKYVMMKYVMMKYVLSAFASGGLAIMPSNLIFYMG